MTLDTDKKPVHHLSVDRLIFESFAENRYRSFEVNLIEVSIFPTMLLKGSQST